MRIRQRPACAALTALALALTLLSCERSPDLPAGLYARMDTPKGRITIALAYDKAPLAVANFAGLAEGSLDANEGRPFYDGLTFHRVEPGFVVQGGDPSGDGTGDPGYTFPDEIDPALSHDGPGVVAMANHGPDTNGCQFYITLEAAPALDGSYTVFGNVIEGMSVVGSIAPGDVISKVTIVRVGDAARGFRSDQAAWNRYFEKASEAAAERSRRARKETVAAIEARWPGLAARPDGMLSSTLKEGAGQVPLRGSLVRVAYRGMLPDGRVFDQSVIHGKPFEFELGTGSVILGWDRAVSEMRVGERRVVAIPPELAYGARGAGGVIPPNSYIVFELELLGFEP